MICILTLVSLFYDYSLSSANDLEEVVKLAEQNDEAMVFVKQFLAKNPAPKNKDLSKLKSEINEIIVRDIARNVTGNKSLPSDSELELLEKQEAQEKEKKILVLLESKPFLDMNQEEVSQYIEYQILHNWRLIFIPVFWIVFLIGFKAFNRMRGGY